MAREMTARVTMPPARRPRRSTAWCSCVPRFRTCLPMRCTPTARLHNGTCSSSYGAPTGAGCTTSWAAAVPSMATNRLLGVLVFCLCRAAMAHEAASPAACQAAAEHPAIAETKAALDANPADLRVRLKLADAWGDAGCFSEALQVLQAGEASNPGNKELQARLRVARRLVSEQGYFDSMDRAAKNATLARSAFRCAKLADVNAGDDALNLQPDDPELLIAKPDA